MNNPLLDFSGAIAFDRITPEDVQPAIAELLQRCEAALAEVTADNFPADWSAISRVLDVATERLTRAFGTVSHLNSVMDTPALRAAYNAALPLVTAFLTRLGADERLYAKYKAMDPAALNAEQRQALANALRGFRLSGAELTGAARERFAQVQERLAQLQQKYSENVLDATDAFSYLARREELAGLPEDLIQACRADAQARGLEGYRLTLQMPCYLPVMQFAQDRALREKLYTAYATRASDQAADAGTQFDNAPLMREILALREEEAALLGYANFGEVSLVPKMADSPEEVLHFLRDLAARARPYAEKDLADLRAFAAAELGLADPQAWDWPYVSEKLKEARYAYNEQEVKQYFPAPKVLAGLFRIVETLFEVRIAPDQAPVWHPAVQFYRIEREGRLLGQFYLDQPARAGKRGGAWMDDARSRWLRPDTGTLQTPVAYLVCNFAEGVDGKPALLTHDDAITLFHEFGHGLQHMLTQVNEHDVSGISGVEWDAVELPSQFMENFCWEWEVLRHMTAHVDTGEPLPRALFDKMLAARNFQAGMQTLRQIEFALFDMLAHTRSEAREDIQALLREVRSEVAVLQPPAFNRFANSFSHVFSGGYAAGYYSYKWAEVLSADAYAAFEETRGPDGMPSTQTGRRYRQAILESGGSRPAIESFKAFRGREPQLDALLRHQGMA
ncbi:M3 family metallopeptidase [Comamonas sp. NLF-1-9]|uniref:M3 family metallopeptidase n=1 Tax=Comamonas sp. NLF-1-9 TaxID=2853163 RepID=UPI001C43E219|nr:M3 family metallopeptidase [Comamonas sp. NLF-1-9]QXL85092.1 M3 family metallopeptidase [Comamonas sp. NLF-1-9]